MSKTSANGGEGALRIVLVPAGETEFAREGRLDGNLDLPLTEEGRRVSERVGAEVLGPLGGAGVFYCAANRASRETAVALANGSPGRTRVLPGLAGVSLGLWEGQRVADVRHRHTRIYHSWVRDPLCITPPGGEEMTDAFQRTKSVVRAILKRHRRGTVAVVAPRTVIGLLLCHLRGYPARRVFEVGRDLGPAEVVAVDSGVRV